MSQCVLFLLITLGQVASVADATTSQVLIPDASGFYDLAAAQSAAFLSFPFSEPVRGFGSASRIIEATFYPDYAALRPWPIIAVNPTYAEKKQPRYFTHFISRDKFTQTPRCQWCKIIIGPFADRAGTVRYWVFEFRRR